MLALCLSFALVEYDREKAFVESRLSLLMERRAVMYGDTSWVLFARASRGTTESLNEGTSSRSPGNGTENKLLRCIPDEGRDEGPGALA